MEIITGIVVSLKVAASCTPADVGAKAYNLALLREAGLPVPDGFVMTTASFARFVEINGFDTATPPDTVRATGLPKDLAAELHSGLERLGWPVAVRSSGVAEDLTGASYAGQYESVLGVDDPARAEEAVRRCWASAFGEHLLRYHRSRGDFDIPGMAVLVQRMVPAKVSGVAFSANPVTGARDEVVINAVTGLADHLVAGEVDSEQWLVRHGEATPTGDPRALTANQALAVSELAIEAAQFFEVPQDIEWAIDGYGVNLVQARPITALPTPPTPIRVEAPEGFWEREASHAPRPWSPLASSLVFEIRNPPLRDVMADFGLLIEAVEFTEIGGWEYVRLVPLGEKDRPNPPRWLMPILIRVIPSMRTRIRNSVAAVRSDLAGTLVHRWHREWQPELTSGYASLRSVDLASLSDAQLVSHWKSVVEHLREGARIHFTLHAATCLPLAELAIASRELLGWEEFRVWDLLAGLSRMSTEPSRRLGALMATAASKPEIRMIIEEGGLGASERLQAADPRFAAELASYREEFEVRALSYDPVTPTLAERPELALGQIADQLARAYDTAATEGDRARMRASALDEARAVLARKAPSEQKRWERAFARAARAYPIREDNEFYTMSRPIALLRYDALELGRRLAGRGQIGSVEDVFFLRHDEIPDALDDGQSRSDLVAERMAERAWAEAHPGPASYGKDPGPPPSLDALPPEARFANQALLWYTERIFEAERSTKNQAGDEIRGIAASAGRYQGPARIVRNEDEFAKIEAGDVLVCPITSPVWSVLFPSIGGLVTDTGGILSHPAIIAREYGVPAVVATGDATQRLQDGEIVTVDGTTGLVVPTGS